MNCIDCGSADVGRVFDEMTQPPEDQEAWHYCCGGCGNEWAEGDE